LQATQEIERGRKIIQLVQEGDCEGFMEFLEEMQHMDPPPLLLMAAAQVLLVSHPSSQQAGLSNSVAMHCCYALLIPSRVDVLLLACKPHCIS
jgi:hypothetical protein